MSPVTIPLVNGYHDGERVGVIWWCQAPTRNESTTSSEKR